MNTQMFENPIVQDNLKKLEHYGYEVIQPAVGLLACKDVGAGKMPEPETLLEYILREVAYEKDLKGKNILVTAGPTQEPIDPVRYLTNHSSGKMGYAIAKVCSMRGADVTLVSGKTAIKPPLFVDVVPVTTARDMYEAVTSRFDQQDIVIKAAAVADYRPKTISDQKVKKADGELSIEMERTDDILKYLGEHKREDQFLCRIFDGDRAYAGKFEKETGEKEPGYDRGEQCKSRGAGFAGDTNIVTLITKDDETQLPLLSKEETAVEIMNKILEITAEKGRTL